VFTNQQCKIKDGFLWFPKKANLDEISVNTKRVTNLNQVRILPRGLYYTVEIVYERRIEDYHLPRDRISAIDLGLNNVVAVVNNVELRPFVIKGGAIKSINQYYNKRRAGLQSLREQQGLKQETKRLQRLTRKRNNMIIDLFHKISRALINYCVAYRIGTIAIGYNALWKQQCNLGKRNNQNFISIPFQTLIQQIQYKAALIGIAVVLVEEAHTSKCSFVDNESIEHHDQYAGQRGVYNPETKKVMRGHFKTQEGKVINSDINGAYNILRKAFPKAIAADGIEGLGLVPYSVKLTELKQWNLNTSAHAHSKVSETDENSQREGGFLRVASSSNNFNFVGFKYHFPNKRKVEDSL
jgi:putative transposase